MFFVISTFGGWDLFDQLQARLFNCLLKFVEMVACGVENELSRFWVTSQALTGTNKALTSTTKALTSTSKALTSTS